MTDASTGCGSGGTTSGTCSAPTDILTCPNPLNGFRLFARKVAGKNVPRQPGKNVPRDPSKNVPSDSGVIIARGKNVPGDT